MVISTRDLAKSKVEKLKKGFSAYTESAQVTELLKRYIQEENLDVIIDQTPLGCWFIPKKSN